MITDQIIQAITDFRRSKAAWAQDIEYGERLMLHNLSMVSDYNMRGEALCGTASVTMQDYLPQYFAEHKIDATVFTATSSVDNGCFHHFNIVKAHGEEAVICDLTASQFFTKPLDSFSGKPYFVGTRRQLRDIVRQAQNNTWEHVQQNFADKKFRTPWDFDLELYTNRDFRTEIGKSLKKQNLPFLIAESLHYPFEITWGDSSRMLRKPETLSETFDIEANVEDLVIGRAPAIPNLITVLSHGCFTRKDGPKAAIL